MFFFNGKNFLHGLVNFGVKKIINANRKNCILFDVARDGLKPNRSTLKLRHKFMQFRFAL